MSMMAEVQQNKASGLKHALSEWREVVLPASSVINMDLEWYPGVIIGLVSTFFLSVWYWDPTLISFVSFCGLLFTVMDYLGPKIINQVYGVDSWTPSKERQFDEVCENVVLGMDKLESLWNLLREARSSKPVFHFVGTLMFFFSLAALGNRINNFFLAYLVTNFVLLMPGLYKKGILQQLYAQTTLKFAEIVKGKDYLKKAE